MYANAWPLCGVQVYWRAGWVKHVCVRLCAVRRLCTALSTSAPKNWTGAFYKSEQESVDDLPITGR